MGASHREPVSRPPDVAAVTLVMTPVFGERTNVSKPAPTRTERPTIVRGRRDEHYKER